MRMDESERGERQQEGARPERRPLLTTKEDRTGDWEGLAQEGRGEESKGWRAAPSSELTDILISWYRNFHSQRPSPHLIIRALCRKVALRE